MPPGSLFSEHLCDVLPQRRDAQKGNYDCCAHKYSVHSIRNGKVDFGPSFHHFPGIAQVPHERHPTHPARAEGHRQHPHDRSQRDSRTCFDSSRGFREDPKDHFLGWHDNGSTFSIDGSESERVLADFAFVLLGMFQPRGEAALMHVLYAS